MKIFKMYNKIYILGLLIAFLDIAYLIYMTTTVITVTSGKALLSSAFKDFSLAVMIINIVYIVIIGLFVIIRTKKQKR